MWRWAVWAHPRWRICLTIGHLTFRQDIDCQWSSPYEKLTLLLTLKTTMQLILGLSIKTLKLVLDFASIKTSVWNRWCRLRIKTMLATNIVLRLYQRVRTRREVRCTITRFWTGNSLLVHVVVYCTAVWVVRSAWDGALQFFANTRWTTGRRTLSLVSTPNFATASVPVFDKFHPLFVFIFLY